MASPHGVVGRSVLRALLRQAAAWEADAAAVAKRGLGAAAPVAAAATDPPRLAVRAPLAPDAWRVGAHGAALAGPAYHAAALRVILDGCGGAFPPLPPGGAWDGAAGLKAWMLGAARLNQAAPSASLDAALAGLRALQAQRAMERCSSTSTTAGVRVEATAALVAKKEAPPGGKGGGLVIDWGGGRGPPAPPAEEEGGSRWLFTYRLRITHVGSGGGGGAGEKVAGAGAGAGAGATTTPHPSIQLLTRAWTIRDGRGRLHASVPPGSPGLVGATPVLARGECFEYFSATDLPGPAGVMKGAFGARWVGEGADGAGKGAQFEVGVSPFALLADPLGTGSGKGGA